MTTWALTGPAGAGKSAASQILVRHGAAVVDGDRLGHEVLKQPLVQAEIVRRLGPGFVQNGAVDRVSLGALVFTDPSAMSVLNAITHGPLCHLAKAELKTLALAGEHELAVFEAAVYFLLPSPPPVDLVVAVVAAPEVRLQRMVDRAGGRLTLEQARIVLTAQAAWESDWRRADELIVNDRTLAELEAQIMHLVKNPKTGSGTQS